MRHAIEKDTGAYRKISEKEQLKPGEVEFIGVIKDDNKWDASTNKFRKKTNAEVVVELREERIEELKGEAVARRNQVDPFASSTTFLASIDSIAAAAEAARTVINGLNRPQLAAYNVTTDPGWPA